jgi:hypothetical protein
MCLRHTPALLAEGSSSIRQRSPHPSLRIPCGVLPDVPETDAEASVMDIMKTAFSDLCRIIHTSMLTGGLQPL